MLVACMCSKYYCDICSTRYYKFADAERNVKKMLKKLINVKTSGDIDAIKNIENTIFEDIRKSEFYYLLSQRFQYDPVYSWFWEEAEKAKFQNLDN